MISHVLSDPREMLISPTFTYSDIEVEALSEGYALCIGGDCIEMLQQTSAVLKVIPYVKVVTHTYVRDQLFMMAHPDQVKSYRFSLG